MSLVGIAADASAQERATTQPPPTTATGITLVPCPEPANQQRGAMTGVPRDGAETRVLRDSAAREAARPAAAGGRPFDIALFASASAASITFAQQPQLRIRLCGGLDSIRVVERRNLPERIVPGQTYRNVSIAVEILGRVDAACLAARLGVQPAPTGSSGRTDGSALGRDPSATQDCAGVTIGTAANAAGRSP